MTITADNFATIMPADAQRHAARIVQDAFTTVFQVSAGDDAANREDKLAEIEQRCQKWCIAGDNDDVRTLRRVLLITGLDQWGLAFTQAFGLTAIPALSNLIGSLRTALDAAEDAQFHRRHAEFEGSETTAIEFKIDLRRNIHLALWHASVACAEDAEADPVIAALGSQLLATAGQMPELGWRLVADALAGIQIRLLAEAGSEAAGERTRRLFEALRGHLPEETWRTILAHSARAVLDWQQSRRPAH